MLTLRPARRRMRRRIEHLPEATHDCAKFGIWIRRPKVSGSLVCVICHR